MRRAASAVDLNDVLIVAGALVAVAVGWLVDPLLVPLVAALLIVMVGLVRSR